MSLVSDVRELLDEKGGAVFWEEEQFYDAINENIIELFASTRHEYGTATITFTASNRNVAIPSNIWIPQMIVGTAGRYFPTTMAKLEQYNREWKLEAAGYPKHFVLNDVFSIMAYPTPDQAYTFVVSGVPWPTVGEIEDTNENPTVTTRLKQAIIKRTVSGLLEYTQPTLSQQLMAESMEDEHGFKMNLRNRQSHNIRRLRPGNLFTRASAGGVEMGRRFS